MMKKHNKKGKVKTYYDNSRGDSGQMVVLMGFFIILGVITLAVISANLSTIGTDVSKVHSKGLLQEFANVKSKLVLAHGAYFNKLGDIEGALKDAYDSAVRDIALLEMKHGNYLYARDINVIEDCGYVGHTIYGPVYSVKTTITLCDGSTTITKDFDYTVSQFDYAISDD